MSTPLIQATIEHLESLHSSMFGRGYDIGTPEAKANVAAILVERLIEPVLKRLSERDDEYLKGHENGYHLGWANAVAEMTDDSETAYNRGWADGYERGAEDSNNAR